MNPRKTTTPARPTGSRPETCFTVDQANRALVLVRKVVADIVGRYARLLELRTRRCKLAATFGTRTQIKQLQREIELSVEQLNHLHQELRAIGCVLKDWAGGLVDFPATYRGRKVWLCWRLGEPAVSHWHELHAGFVQRRAIGPDFA